MAKQKLTFRQRLRLTANERLSNLEERLDESVTEIVQDSGISGTDLLKVGAALQNKTHRNDCITKIANQMEDELEALYNKQQKLPGMDDNA